MTLSIVLYLSSVGSILCSIQIPVKVATKFEARIIVFNIDIPITVGFPVSSTHYDIMLMKITDTLQVIIHYQSLNEPAVIKKLISLLNRNSGELVRKNPRYVSMNFECLKCTIYYYISYNQNLSLMHCVVATCTTTSFVCTGDKLYQATHSRKYIIKF